MLGKADRAGAADRPTLGNQGQEIARLWLEEKTLRQKSPSRSTCLDRGEKQHHLVCCWRDTITEGPQLQWQLFMFL